MCAKRSSQTRKAEAETMVLANSVSVIMEQHAADIKKNTFMLEEVMRHNDHSTKLQGRNEQHALNAIEEEDLQEENVDRFLRGLAAWGDDRAQHIAKLAQVYNDSYDRIEKRNEQLPDKLIRPVLAMAQSNAVRTGAIEGEVSRGKRKASRSAPARKVKR